jgi:ribosomal protein S14
MRYDITNIPVTEVFEEGDGCPICRLRNKLEDRAVEYITGAAMMEPDIRIETNKQGFCLDHYRMMLKRKNRLSVALMLESHLDEMEKQVFAGLPLVGKGSRKQAKSAGKAAETCYVCGQLDGAMEKMLATVCRTWEAQGEFRQLFEKQDCLCLPHFSALVEAAAGSMSKKEQPYFAKAASKLAHNYLTELRGDVHHFCEMYDYRNTGEDADWGNSKDSIERAIWYLTTREP